MRAASLMRLNAIWGLEEKDQSEDIYKADLNDLELAEGSGVFPEQL